VKRGKQIQVTKKPMSNSTITRLLGIALIAGGTIVGIVMMILMSNYAREGIFTPTNATLAVVTSFIFLVLPQIGLGVYLIWYSMGETAVSPSKNPPPPE
jgi:hypothetical protein